MSLRDACAAIQFALSNVRYKKSIPRRAFTDLAAVIVHAGHGDCRSSGCGLGRFGVLPVQQKQVLQKWWLNFIKYKLLPMICLPQIQDAMRGPVAIDCMLLAPFDTHFDASTRAAAPS